MNLIGVTAIDRYIGHWQPYATNHQALDADTAVQDEFATPRGRSSRVFEPVAMESRWPPLKFFIVRVRSD